MEGLFGIKTPRLPTLEDIFSVVSFFYYFFKFEDGALSFSGTLDVIGGTERSEIALIETSPSVVLQIVQHL